MHDEHFMIVKDILSSKALRNDINTHMQLISDTMRPSEEDGK
jgi:hypothetical protein